MTFELLLLSVILAGLVIASVIKDWRNMKDMHTAMSAHRYYERALIDQHAAETRHLVDTIVAKNTIDRAVGHSIDRQAVPSVQTLASANLMAGIVPPKPRTETVVDPDGHLDG